MPAKMEASPTTAAMIANGRKNCVAALPPMYLPSMDLLIAHPAKIMEMRYKMKLMTARGAVNALPTPKAMLMMMDDDV